MGGGGCWEEDVGKEGTADTAEKEVFPLLNRRERGGGLGRRLRGGVREPDLRGEKLPRGVLEEAGECRDFP